MFTRDNTNDLYTDATLNAMNIELARNMAKYGQFQLSSGIKKHEMGKILSEQVQDKVYN